MMLSRVVAAYVQRRLLSCSCSRSHDSATSTSINDMDDSTMTDFEEMGERRVEIVEGDEIIHIASAEILSKLPEHIMTCIIQWEERRPVDFPRGIASTTMEYVCHMIRLFVSQCNSIGWMESSLELFDINFERHLIDSISFLLLAMACGKFRFMEALKEIEDTKLLRDVAAAIEVAPSCLMAVMVYLTERGRVAKSAELPYEERVTEFSETYDVDYILDGLLKHPRGYIFLQSALDAVTNIIQMLVEKLHHDKNTDYLPPTAVSRSIECSVMLLERLMSYESMYHWYLAHDPNAISVLKLICASLDLASHGLSSPPFFSVIESNEYTFEARHRQGQGNFYPTDTCKGLAELIAGRACAIIVSLGHHSPPFLDLIWHADLESKTLAKYMNQSVIYILKQVFRRPSTSCQEPSLGEGQLAINCLRAANTLSINSDFTKLAREKVLGDIIYLLSNMPPEDFKSFWCLGPLSIQYMTFDQFMVNSTSIVTNRQNYIYYAATEGDRRESFVDFFDIQVDWSTCGVSSTGEYSARLSRGLRFALERSILLIKLIYKFRDKTSHDDALFTEEELVSIQGGERVNIQTLEKNLSCLYILASKCQRGISPLLEDIEMVYLRNTLRQVHAVSS